MAVFELPRTVRLEQHNQERVRVTANVAAHVALEENRFVHALDGSAPRFLFEPVHPLFERIVPRLLGCVARGLLRNE